MLIVVIVAGGLITSRRFITFLIVGIDCVLKAVTDKTEHIDNNTNGTSIVPIGKVRGGI